MAGEKHVFIFELLVRSRLRFLCCFTEHLNIILFTVSKQYHQAMSKTDTSSLTFSGKFFFVTDEIQLHVTECTALISCADCRYK